MKKLLLSTFVIVAFITYVFFQKFGDKDDAIAVTPPSQISNQTNPSQSPVSNLPAPASKKYKDGTYTGAVEDAYYGPYQVAAIISNGQITDIKFIQYPSDRSTSVRINSEAMPFLKQEAIQSQSAQVDIISGATQSSRAFSLSLQSALDKAV